MITYIVEKILFIKKFFTQPFKNASIRPTSKNVAVQLAKSIVWENVNSIVEIGAGTGALTKELIKNMPKDALYIIIEYDPEFVTYLEKLFSDERMVIINGNIKNIQHILTEKNIDCPDVIVSSLPNNVFAQYPESVKYIEQCTQKGSQFRVITYLINTFFGIFHHLRPRKIAFCLRNIPPLYICGVN